MVALRVRELTDEENEQIKRLAHSRTAPARRVERARMIWLASQGRRVAAIATDLHVTAETVRLWLKRFNAAGLEGLKDAPRSGRPATYTPEQVGEVIAAALTNPQHLNLPFGCWTLDRLEAYLNEEKGIPIKRSRIDELLIAEGLRWRTQETWFGERASIASGADRPATPPPLKKEREVDPDFAQKRGPSRPCIRPLPQAV
jgi:transposase